MPPRYDLCKKLANRLLLKQEFTSLKIDICSFKHDKPIFIYTFDEFMKTMNANFDCYEQEGCTIKHKDSYAILYKPNLNNVGRERWTIIHEMGHIYLGHEEDTRDNELEADFFAASLLMPEITLIAMSHRVKLTNKFISNTFGVSNEAAAVRLKYIINLKTTGTTYEYSDQKLLEKQYDNMLNECIDFHNIKTLNLMKRVKRHININK
jgi:Zn-dependent peptidase ImmA (M78 family)